MAKGGARRGEKRVDIVGGYGVGGGCNKRFIQKQGHLLNGERGEGLDRVLLMDIYDHYREAKRVAGLLATEGFRAESEQLVEAIEKGKSGTEIFMHLRHLIEPLMTTERLSDTTKARIEILHAKLDESLEE